MQEPHPHHHCLNCGAPVSGRFCASCGQQTSLHHDSFWHMIGHFIADYFHYDGKFFTTLKKLTTRPGYLTRMYMAGKRARYLHPIQLYIFVSAVFFLVFFKAISIDVENSGPSSISLSFSLGGHHEIAPDSVVFARYDSARVFAMNMREDMQYADSMLKASRPGFSDTYLNNLGLHYVSHYAWNHQLFTGSEILESILEQFLHTVPKMFFFLMPLLALFLKFFFGRKKFFYVDHAVMSLHFHSFLFISFIAGLLTGFIGFDHYILSLLFFFAVPPLYFIIACRNLYEKSWLYTSVMSLLTLGLYTLFVTLAAVINLAVVIMMG